jgi:hypothetical protein
MYSISILTLAAANISGITFWVIRQDRKYWIKASAIYLVGPSNAFIKRVLNQFRGLLSDNENPTVSKEELKVGACIGIMERWLILALVLMGEISAIAFVLAAKSAIRYPMLDDKYFAEYFLLGTLLSTSLALLLGLFLQYIVLPMI